MDEKRQAGVLSKKSRQGGCLLSSIAAVGIGNGRQFILLTIIGYWQGLPEEASNFGLFASRNLGCEEVY
jgi:hypothetical protein